MYFAIKSVSRLTFELRVTSADSVKDELSALELMVRTNRNKNAVKNLINL